MPTRGNGVTIIPDTAGFRYDLAGRVTAANNRYARITRSYAANGALLMEEQRLRLVNTAAPSPGEELPAVPAPYFPGDWYGGSGIQMMEEKEALAPVASMVGSGHGPHGRERDGRRMHGRELVLHLH